MENSSTECAAPLDASSKSSAALSTYAGTNCIHHQLIEIAKISSTDQLWAARSRLRHNESYQLEVYLSAVFKIYACILLHILFSESARVFLQT